MDQSWFEMTDIRRRKLEGAVWIPLRASELKEEGRHGYAGFKSEFHGLGSLAVPAKKRDVVSKLGYNDLGIRHSHGGHVEGRTYVPSDAYAVNGATILGLHLVLDQSGNSLHPAEWHLHQDFVLTMALRREEDNWLAIEEGYIVVARLVRDEKGSPIRCEVRASYLKDYLCARRMALFTTSYRQRTEICEDASHIQWPNGRASDRNASDSWEGHVCAIHEGGMPYGEEWAIFRSGRVDDQADVDVPVIRVDDEAVSSSTTAKSAGRKLHRVDGELWRNEWIEPASASPLVRHDKTPATEFFIVDAEGRRESEETLVDGGRWLWFRPDVVMSLLSYKGSGLGWYTRDTGHLRCSSSGGVHFGVNSIGLINVYAKDIALLPRWQQSIWAGHNVSPEGGVSAELLAAQNRCEPADTQAPEAFLGQGLKILNQLAKSNIGITLVRDHPEVPELLARTHRFRATDKAGLFSLAKDLARLTADRFDVGEIRKVLQLPKEDKSASLKLLERLLATQIYPEVAHQQLGPLFKIYELRLGDAHLASSDLTEAFQLLEIDQSAPYVMQGYRLLFACVDCLYFVIKEVKRWKRREAANGPGVA